MYGPFSGQVTSAARQALRRAVLEADPRLVEALFLCEVGAGAVLCCAVLCGGRCAAGAGVLCCVVLCCAVL